MELSPFQFELYRAAAPLAVGLLVIFLIASVSARRVGRSVLRVYAAFVVITIGYVAANYLEVSSRTEATNLFWSKVMYIFIVVMPIVWLDFCLRFAREDRGLPLPALLASALIPAATLVFVWMPSLSSLMWSEISFARQGDYVVSLREHGPWFTVYAIYTYGYYLAGCAVALRAFSHYRRYYSKQAAWVIAGVLMPLAASLAYVLKPFPSLVKDYTPLGYAAAAVLFYVALFHRGLFSIAPVGRSTVVERLAEGVLVLDPEDRLVDANPSAMRILGLEEKSLGQVFSAPASAAMLEAIASRNPSDIRVDTPKGSRNYRVEPSSLPQGRLVVITDQTELRDLLARVETLALRDELTGLPNRRCFFSDGERELARAKRRGLTASAAMIDFDSFKTINDTRGHAAGDALLRAFGSIVAAELRADDMAGRLGGDEFALLAIGGPESLGIRSLCERLRSRLASADIRDEVDKSVGGTISIGIAVYDPKSMPGLEALLASADAALYAAKHRGKDRIALFGQD
jgi:diguanylate cyclase (GGDEF) domain